MTILKFILFCNGQEPYELKTIECNDETDEW